MRYCISLKWFGAPLLGGQSLFPYRWRWAVRVSSDVFMWGPRAGRLTQSGWGRWDREGGAGSSSNCARSGSPPPPVSGAAVRGGDINTVITMADCTAGWGPKVKAGAACERGAGERLRSATSHSRAVKCRAAGRLDRMIFADPKQWGYFHELIPSRKHNDMGEGFFWRGGRRRVGGVKRVVEKWFKQVIKTHT